MDTVKMARKSFPGLPSYSLGKLCRSLGIQIQNRHRAAGDAMATLKVFQKVLHNHPEQADANSGQLNSTQRQSILEGLPHETGVYFFYDEDGKVIYVGKSNDIRQRVVSHLANDRSVKGSSMRDRIAAASYEVTGSETLALLRESAEIKSRMPVFNIKSRRKTYTFGIFVNEDDKGYLRLGIERISSKNEPLITLSSKAEGKALLVKYWENYHLCQKLCGLYKTTHACFHYSIRQCNGACLGIEPPESYNRRVQKLIDSLVPSVNSFAIIDKGRKRSERSIMIVRNGEYKGYTYHPAKLLPSEDLNRLSYIPQEHNRDVRQIINHCLRNKNYLELVTLD